MNIETRIRQMRRETTLFVLYNNVHRNPVSLLVTRGGWIMQNSDPAQPFLSCINGDLKSKDEPGPFTQQGWSPTLKLVKMSGGVLPTFLPLSSGLPIRSFLLSLFLSRTSSLLTTASILEPMLFMDCSRCNTRCRRLGKTWRNFTIFFLRWTLRFAAGIPWAMGQISIRSECSTSEMLIHTHWTHNSLLHWIFICDQWFCRGWIPTSLDYSPDTL